jgi:two-component system response regulator DevR
VTAAVFERLRHRDDDDPVNALTDQERVLIDLLAQGMTNRQIGEQMNLAEKTIKNYVSNILTKLGMTRRTEIAVFAARAAERRAARTAGG